MIGTTKYDVEWTALNQSTIGDEWITTYEDTWERGPLSTEYHPRYLGSLSFFKRHGDILPRYKKIVGSIIRNK